jgi:hypothetical protein
VSEAVQCGIAKIAGRQDASRQGHANALFDQREIREARTAVGGGQSAKRNIRIPDLRERPGDSARHPRKLTHRFKLNKPTRFQSRPDRRREFLGSRGTKKSPGQMSGEQWQSDNLHTCFKPPCRREATHPKGQRAFHDDGPPLHSR